MELLFPAIKLHSCVYESGLFSKLSYVGIQSLVSLSKAKNIVAKIFIQLG